ncbi:MAG: hypothetical protein H6654_14910 [Ardenticatenaceae bacterium]|nr:hypothetical protein [Ardenticatenaceae bacterium]
MMLLVEVSLFLKKLSVLIFLDTQAGTAIIASRGEFCRLFFVEHRAYQQAICLNQTKA